ncbi:MAG: SMI1/KNR4 family protein [Nitrospira sp. CR2.1]|nr:SMI1/KNR4 family protein [Nitrospira sp. CR2.1]
MKITPFGKATAAQIGLLEKQIGSRLPDDYRSFLIENNGGEVNDSLFFVHELGEDILFDVFFGFNEKRALDLNFWIDELEGERPENSLMIGKDPGGNFILLDWSNKRPGIYYWDRGFCYPDSSEENSTYFVAKSFTDFVIGFKRA